MTELATPSRPPRPEFRNINAFKDLPTYRLPVAGWVSILHRVSKEQGHSTAIVTLSLSTVLTIVLGAKLFGLF